MSRSASADSNTVNRICGLRLYPAANSREGGAGRPHLSGADAFVCQCQNLEERQRLLSLVITCDVLQHCLGLAIDSDDNRSFALSDAADDVWGFGLEFADRHHLT